MINYPASASDRSITILVLRGLGYQRGSRGRQPAAGHLEKDQNLGGESAREEL
jgi:hypothetical protein